MQQAQKVVEISLHCLRPQYIVYQHNFDMLKVSPHFLPSKNTKTSKVRAASRPAEQLVCITGHEVNRGTRAYTKQAVSSETVFHCCHHQWQTPAPTTPPRHGLSNDGVCCECHFVHNNSDGRSVGQSGIKPYKKNTL